MPTIDGAQRQEDARHLSVVRWRNFRERERERGGRESGGPSCRRWLERGARGCQEEPYSSTWLLLEPVSLREHYKDDRGSVSEGKAEEASEPKLTKFHFIASHMP